ncbi:MAG: hypothetical protein K6G56_02020 [Clostridiales bacterium]|nr:hypothetical protein [Clostridiales bacterium]
MKSPFKYRWIVPALILLIALASAFSACRKKPSDDIVDVVIDIPSRDMAGPTAHTPTLEPETTEVYSDPTEAPAPTDTPKATATPSPAPTAAPTQTPSADEMIRRGIPYALNNGDPIGYGWKGERVDIDGDGAPEFINIREVDGGLTLCIDDEPFLADDFRVYLVSLDGRHVVFLVDKGAARQDGYSIFYPDPYGNLYCRLFGVVRHGKPEDFVKCDTFEDYIKNGLDIMLLNPVLYSSTAGGRRTILLDMDGDGVKDEIVIDGSTLYINGYEDTQMLAATLPRFFYDEQRNAIGIYGSGGDYAIRLWLHADGLEPEVSYVKLL